jgi:hypothetical protein
MTPETGIKKKSIDPYNCNSPVIGVAARTAIHHPLGVQPHFKQQTQVWNWINGNQPDSDPTQYTDNQI